MAKILIVDDDVGSGTVLKLILNKINPNFELTVLDRSIDFIHSYDKTYDIIILDIYMPVVDGFELAKFVRNNKDDAVLIAYTASLLSHKELELFDYFFIKPIDIERFKSVITKLTTKK